MAASEARNLTLRDSSVSTQQSVDNLLPENHVNASDKTPGLVDFNTSSASRPHTYMECLPQDTQQFATHVEIARLDHLPLRKKELFTLE